MIFVWYLLIALLVLLGAVIFKSETLEEPDVRLLLVAIFWPFVIVVLIILGLSAIVLNIVNYILGG